MSRLNNQLRHITYAAWRLTEAPLWLDALAEEDHAAALPALCDLLTMSADEIVRVQAARALARRFASHESARHALHMQLSSPSSPVRSSVVRHTPAWALSAPTWRRVLARDPAPLVRRAAARALASLHRWSDIARICLSDPVWRVRRDGAESLIRAGLSRRQLDRFLAQADDRERFAGRALAFIRARIADDVSLPPQPERPAYTRLPWWSEDPAVMLAALKHVPADDLHRSVPDLIPLVEWQDGYPLTNCMREMRALIGGLVRDRDDIDAWRQLAGYLDRPRIPYAQAWAREWLGRCPQLDALTAAVLATGRGRESLAFAIASQPASQSEGKDARAIAESVLACAQSVHPEVRAGALDKLGAWLRASTQGTSHWLSEPAHAVALSAVRAPEPDVCAAAVGVLYVVHKDWRAVRAHLPGILDDAAIDACLQHLPDAWLRAEADSPWLVELAWPVQASTWPDTPEANAELPAAPLADCRIPRRIALAKRARAAGLQSICDQLGRDPDHFVRAAALSRERAAELCAHPDREPSWRVLARAAALCQRPLHDLAPAGLRTGFPPGQTGISTGISTRISGAGNTDPDIPDGRRQSPPPDWHTGSYFQTLELSPVRAIPPVSLPALDPPLYRPLASGRTIAPLIISGRHSLSETGFAHALEGGVNCLFWEPEYRSQTRFIRSLSPGTRQQLAFIGGTFAHEPDEVLADLEGMLHVLDIDCVDIFFLFWVRDRQRLEERVARALLDAQAAGKVGSFGLSTHDRGLAAWAIEGGWNTLMVRHSAAHPGIETEVLPDARASGAQILTFSNLTYTLMLRSRAGRPPPYQAADCYRYSISQPGVTACISAPRTVREVKHNLQVIRQPALAADAAQRMRAHAARVRLESHRMMRLIRAD